MTTPHSRNPHPQDPEVRGIADGPTGEGAGSASETCEGSVADNLASRLDATCLQYLLGELSPSEVTQLEHQLEHSPEANRRLADQAQWLAALGSCQRFCSRPDGNVEAVGNAPTVGNAPAVGDTPSGLALAGRGYESILTRRWVTLAASLAAGLLLALLVYRSLDDRSALEARNKQIASPDEYNGQPLRDETLLIARAWASDHRTEFNTSDEPDESSDDWADADRSNDEFDQASLDQDSVLSWMIAGVASDASLQTPTSTSENLKGETGDG